jgi:hypothetical protein
VSFLVLVAVAAPAAGAVAAVVLPERAMQAVRIGALTSAACWFVLLVDASSVSSSRLHAVPLVAAAACGAALIVAAVDGAAVERPTLLGLALTATSVALAAGRTATDGGGVVAALAIAGALAAAAGRAPVRVWAMAAVGLVLAAVGVVALRSATNSWQLPFADASASHRGDGVLIVLGAALLVLAGVQRSRAPVTVLVPAGAFLTAQAAPMVHRADGLTWLAVVLGLAAVAAALAARIGRPLLDRPAAALTLMGLAALVAPGATLGPGLLLAAGGALAAVFGWPAAAALGVPGGVALAIALAAHGGGAAFVVGALAGAVALALAAAVLRAGPLHRPEVWMTPALALGAWLLVAPGTWGWVGPVSLRAYDLGAARSVAGAALCLVILVLLGRDPARWYARAFPPDSPGEDAVRH